MTASPSTTSPLPEPGFFRSRFRLPVHNGADAVYFLGNSLGLQPTATGAALEQVLNQWGQLGVEGFFRGELPWLQAHTRLQPLLAGVVGAKPAEVVAMNQLTVNIHLLLVSFYQPLGKRRKILCEARAFCSDQYALHSHVQQRGLDPADVIVEVAPRPGEDLIREEDILAAIEQHESELALLFWGGVNYYTGQVFDIETLTAAAHKVGAMAGFDLAHAAGNIPLHLNPWKVDFAAWCSYKYLNAGPGGIGCAFIHERHHHDPALQRFAGWWGYRKESQFLMEPSFLPEPSAEGWQLSTPSPLLYAALETALLLFAEAGTDRVWEANRRLTQQLWDGLARVQGAAPPRSLKILTPASEANRGCQVSLEVRNGKQVFDYLTAQGVFADWREPAVIRVAPVAFYNTTADVHRFTDLLQEALITFAA